MHDTFPTGTARDTTELLGVRCAVKTRGACTYEKSKGVQHHLRGNQGSRERADTASLGFERERTLPVQDSRESGHRQFRARERADTASPGFEGEQTPLFQVSRESRHGQFRVRERAEHGLKRKPAEEAALVHRTG